MNTTPDEALLALWLDDELRGEDLARVDAWALTQPDQLAMREEVRSFRKMMSAALPAEVEPPYPDFFNSRIEKAIREQAEKSEPAAALKTPFWRSWFLPASAFTGMALAFWVGTKTNSQIAAVAPLPKIEEPSLATPVYYTPEQGVEAKWVNKKGSATVIVLQGVNAIPDALDFSETASYQNPESEAAGTAATISAKEEPAK